MSSSKKCDSFKDLRKGKYNWKVPARVLNLWRGYTKAGEPFKGFNMLLLDPQRARIHAFVLFSVAEEIEKKVEVGHSYLIQNFTVKDYKTEEKFRCIRKDIQIIFDTEIILKPLQESDVNIERCWFDFYDLADLKPLANQNTYLTDVIGVVEEHDPVGKVRNRHGGVQSQIKFNITDGRTSVKVTFWDEFADLFAESAQGDLEHPMIIIIGSVRVTMWENEVILTNLGCTTFYINYNHHSVNVLRKRCSKANFCTQTLSTQKNRNKMLYQVKDIKNLGHNYMEIEVLCQVKILSLHQFKNWCNPVCTSCYQKIQRLANVDMCNNCNRVVPYADMRFEIYTMASDETGPIELMLEDREVRTMIGKTIFQLMNEANNVENWPSIFQTILNKNYTVKLNISEANINKQQDFYLATDIMEGFILDSPNLGGEDSTPHPISFSEAQSSGSSYHLASFSIGH